MSVITWIAVKTDLLHARTFEEQLAHLDTDSLHDNQVNREQARAQEIETS